MPALFAGVAATQVLEAVLVFSQGEPEVLLRVPEGVTAELVERGLLIHVLGPLRLEVVVVRAATREQAELVALEILAEALTGLPAQEEVEAAGKGPADANQPERKAVVAVEVLGF
jgi:hypothetical protein